MALDSNILKQGFLDLQKTPPKTPFEAAQKIAAFYTRYAEKANDPIGGSPVSLFAAQALFQATLVPALSVFSPDPSIPAQAFALAATTFWMLPPIVFGGGAFPGVVTAAPGGPLLAAALISIWTTSVPSKTNNDSITSQMASAFHAFTKTVLILDAVVPTPVTGPLT